MVVPLTLDRPSRVAALALPTVGAITGGGEAAVRVHRLVRKGRACRGFDNRPSFANGASHLVAHTTKVAITRRDFLKYGIHMHA